MKNTFVATFLNIAGLTISGLVMSGLAIATPASAQNAIVAALYQNPTPPQTEVRYETNHNRNDNQIILAVNTRPEVMAIAETLLTKSYDRIVTMSRTDKLGCMVNGSGSSDGAVMCGFIDYE